MESISDDKPQIASVLRAVKAQCMEGSVRVTVERDLLGLGQFIRPSDISLGGCPFDQQDDSSFLFLETALHECRRTLQVHDDYLVFSYTLEYTPSAIDGTAIVRANAVEIGIQCHYLRNHNGSSDSLKPTQIPLSATVPSKGFLDFSLKLMTDHWNSERPSNVYFLGDIIHIEASVALPSNIPLRLFVDSCVATLEPDATAVLRYAFVENYGCLIDARLTSSKSHFIPRTQDHKLLLQLEAFRFHQEVKSSIYINCHLRLTAASKDTDSVHKTCYTEGSRWRSVDGDDEVCDCCDSNCDAPDSQSRRRIGRKSSDLNSEKEALELEGDASVVVFIQPRESLVAEAEAKKVVHEPNHSRRTGLACIAAVIYRRRRRFLY
ncbi:zona pellucida sperm-binding protein 3-like [Megalops cyprinoides]|uniref:zona pellucida sperm-binding protein 3-like n=1 Tax=Megalops cyprinoides TaxID=118141 RepID=UPI001863FD7C|nr:zona pellucida sperm-binding protein 3-like [Megalops cyprinoides]